MDVPPEAIRALSVQLYLINKRTPIWIKPQLKITEVSRNGETILFSMETTLPGDRWTKEMHDHASPETTKGLCSDKDMRALLGYAFQMRYVVTDPSGRYVTGFFASKDQCLTTALYNGSRDELRRTAPDSSSHMSISRMSPADARRPSCSRRTRRGGSRLQRRAFAKHHN